MNFESTLAAVMCLGALGCGRVPGPDAAIDSGTPDAGRVVAPTAGWTHPIGDGGSGYLFPQWGSTIWGAGDEIYVGGVSGVVYHSTDDGRTFTRLLVDTVAGLAPNVIWGNSLEDVVVVAGFGETFRTRDHGQTWQTVTAPFHGDQGLTALWGTGDALCLLAGSESVTSSDDGLTWQPWAPPPAIASGVRPALWGRGTERLIAGAANLFRSTDNGATWATSGPGNVAQIWTDSTGRIVTVQGTTSASMPATALFVSEDDGVTWVDRSPPGGAAFLGIPVPSALWLIELSGTVVRSDDGGRTWTTVTTVPTLSTTVLGGWVTASGSVIALLDGPSMLWRWGPP